MSFDRVCRIRSRLIVSVLGGPAASLLSGILAIIVGEIGLTRHYDSPWPTSLEFFGVWSFFVGSVSLIPFKSRGFANDGMILRGLACRKEEALPVIASYAFSAIGAQTPFEPAYLMRWIKIAARPSNLQSNHYAANWLGYSTATESEGGAQFLERCLAESSLMEDDARDQLISEAAFFTASRRNDFSKAEVWLNRIKSPSRLHPLWMSRVRVALFCAQNNFGQAGAEINQALRLIRQQPATKQRQKVEAEWTAWSDQVERRLASV